MAAASENARSTLRVSAQTVVDAIYRVRMDDDDIRAATDEATRGPTYIAILAAVRHVIIPQDDAIYHAINAAIRGRRRFLGVNDDRR
jgi:hypothetical protein